MYRWHKYLSDLGIETSIVEVGRILDRRDICGERPESSALVFPHDWRHPIIAFDGSREAFLTTPDLITRVVEWARRAEWPGDVLLLKDEPTEGVTDNSISIGMISQRSNGPSRYGLRADGDCHVTRCTECGEVTVYNETMAWYCYRCGTGGKIYSGGAIPAVAWGKTDWCADV